MCVSPGEWESNCDELQKMLVVRCLRQDRVSSCVTTFVINHLGARFVEPPVLDMKAVSLTLQTGCNVSVPLKKNQSIGLKVHLISLGLIWSDNVLWVCQPCRWWRSPPAPRR